MKAYKIEQYNVQVEDIHFQTKFGGQPDWISTPQWPVSEAWGNRPMKFIGQIRLDEFLEEVEEMTLAYIFMTQPEDRNDTFYDPDIIFPDSGESAVIIQPTGEIQDYIKVIDCVSGPSVDNEQVRIPQLVECEEDTEVSFEKLDVDKFCGIPAFFQNSQVEEGSALLLQLHTNWLPFYINAGGEPTMFIFLRESKKEGFILIEDM